MVDEHPDSALILLINILDFSCKLRFLCLHLCDVLKYETKTFRFLNKMRSTKNWFYKIVEVFFVMITKDMRIIIPPHEIQLFHAPVVIYLFHSNSTKYFRLKRLLFFTRAVSLSHFMSLPHSLGVG